MNATNHYTRMFPRLARASPAPDSPLWERLEALGKAMFDDEDAEAGNRDPFPRAGFTYLGQFIDHDLNLDITPLESAHPNVAAVHNFRTPLLDLDHVYGGGPTVSPFLYEMERGPGKEQFLIGWTGEATLRGRRFKAVLADLPRNSKGIALTADPRQDENLILAQLHVAFLKLHNCIVGELQKGKASRIPEAGPLGGTVFEKARRIMTWHYQYIAVNEFLPLFVEEEVLRAAHEKCASQDNSPFQIPIEFSAAAFRFGHSLVRDVYSHFNSHHSHVPLACLLALTGPGGELKPPCEGLAQKPQPFRLPADWTIDDWTRFFPNEQQPSSNGARKIDPLIASTLHNLKLEIVLQFSGAVVGQDRYLPKPANILPVRTLWRGARMGLPSGQDVALAMGMKKENVLTAPDLLSAPRKEITDVISKCDFDIDTPLWYYILREAEVFGKQLQLGPVGGRIVAEVIIGAVRSDPNSYLSVNPTWQPTIASRMANILTFVENCYHG
jgi:Animal haem peroxidase